MSFEGVITRKHPTDLFLPDFGVVFRRLFPFLLCLRCVSPPLALCSSTVSPHCTVKSVTFSVDRLLSFSRLPESETEVKNKITDYNSSLYCDGFTALYTCLGFYLFRKQKPINIVRKKRTQLTVRVVEITMEMRYTDIL